MDCCLELIDGRTEVVPCKVSGRSHGIGVDGMRRGRDVGLGLLLRDCCCFLERATRGACCRGLDGLTG